MIFFASIQVWVDRVTRHLLLVGGGTYSVELVKVRASWPGHHGYQKKKILNLYLDSQVIGVGWWEVHRPPSLSLDSSLILSLMFTRLDQFIFIFISDFIFPVWGHWPYACTILREANMCYTTRFCFYLEICLREQFLTCCPNLYETLPILGRTKSFGTISFL